MKDGFLYIFPQVALLPVPVVRLGLVSRIFSGGTPDKSNLAYWESGDLPWIGSGEVNQFLVQEPTGYITAEAVKASSTKLMPRGSLIMALAGQGKTKAMVAQMGFDAYGNQSLACIADFKGSSRYLFWWLTSLYHEVRGLSSEDTRDGLNQSMLGRLPVPRFDLETQNAIAAFLDRETALIDDLIEKKQQLISLLSEKLRTTIAQTITPRGEVGTLNQESSAEWFGVVPMHWKILKTKRVFRLVCNPAPEDNDAELLSVYTEIGVRPRKELEQRGNKASTTDGYWIVRRGDLVVNKLLAWMGAIGYSAYDGVTSPAYDVLRPIMPVEPKFYHYLFR